MTGENVLVVLADDMRADFLPYMVDMASWPARRFTRARTNTGLCGPFRWSQMTGQWHRDHGVGTNPATLEEYDLENTLPGWVKAGPGSYRTGMFGKYLNADKVPVPPACFDVWRQLVDNPDGSTYRMVGFGVWDGTDELEPPGTMLDHLRDEVLAFAGASTDPWFAWLCPTSPHYPFNPLPGDLFAWSHVRGPEPPDLHPSKPSWFQALPPLGWATRAAHRAAARAQARELTAMDRMLTQLLAGLAAMDQLDNTVIMFTSDNGLNYGENRQPGIGTVKNDLTEASLRVPMVCMGPGFTAGESTAQVSADVDVNATVVAITGCAAEVGLPFQRGLDLRSLQGAPPPRPLLHERKGNMAFDWIGYDGVGVSTADRKLMRWLGAPSADEHELYDLDADPLELVNVAGDAAYADDLAELQTILDGLLV